MKKIFKNYLSEDEPGNTPLQDFLSNFTVAIISVLVTALAIQAVSFFIYYPGGLVGWIAGLLVSTAQATGITEFQSLYAGFSAAMIMLVFLLLFFIWSFIPHEAEADNEYIENEFRKLSATLNDIRINVAGMDTQIQYLYEQGCVKEYEDIADVQKA